MRSNQTVLFQSFRAPGRLNEQTKLFSPDAENELKHARATLNCIDFAGNGLRSGPQQPTKKPAGC
ncbi:protein of unknown function [Aminobacter niigataensis]|nr:protein of unknown function [Aminobacter niigataensis]